MFPDLNSTTLWMASNGFGAAMFTALMLFIIVVDHRDGAMRLVLAAVAVNAIWLALLTTAPVLDASGPLLDVAETLRTGLWLLLAAWLYPAPTSGASRYLRRWLAVLLPLGLAVFLGWRLFVTFTFGSPIVGHSLVFACGITLISLWGLSLLERVYFTVSPEARWALKYLCLAIGTLFTYDFLMYSVALLYQHIDLVIWDARGAVNGLIVPLIGLAVVRNASWSARLRVSHKAVFGTGTLLAGGAYLLVFAVGGYYIRTFGGDWGQVVAFCVMVLASLALIAVAMSTQARAYVRVFINKHLFRYKYDYRNEWLALNRRLSNRSADANPYRRAITAVAELMDSPAGALWLERDDVFVCAAHSNMPEATEITMPADTPLVDFMRETAWIADLDEYEKDASRYGEIAFPAWLPEIEKPRFLIPLFAEDRLLGVMLLAEPRAAYRLGWEETDLLKTLGRQIGVFLDQQESSQALAQARQFEAFNRLTAFLMHDLKNIAAQQSLMLHNAQRHKGNPEFVDDMILTIDHSVNRMHGLLGQLQRVSAEEQVSRRVDVDEVLAQVAEELKLGTPSPVIVGDRSAAVLNVDPDRFAMVVRHVVRNAQDAAADIEPDCGSVALRAYLSGAFVAIEVRDNGVGMSESFIRESLFRPFFSTKSSRGMGIGAYQVREFARGVGGDVQVESVVGQGTCFTLTIPVASAPGGVASLNRSGENIAAGESRSLQA